MLYSCIFRTVCLCILMCDCLYVFICVYVLYVYVVCLSLILYSFISSWYIGEFHIHIPSTIFSVLYVSRQTTAASESLPVYIHSVCMCVYVYHSSLSLLAPLCNRGNCRVTLQMTPLSVDLPVCSRHLSVTNSRFIPHLLSHHSLLSITRLVASYT